MVRGLRNNNPGNIRHGAKWQGLKAEQTDKDFCQFVSMEMGIRALVRILFTYYNKYKLRSVKAIISRYAPPNENNTTAYINSVAEKLGVKPDDRIQLTDVTLKPIVDAIIRVECGTKLDDATVNAGIKLAL